MTPGRLAGTVVAICVIGAVTAQAYGTLARQASDRAHLSGRVVAADTGVVVRGAVVTCILPSAERLIVTTDDDGRFEFRDLPVGPATCKVGKAGFVEATVPTPALKAGQRQNAGDVRMVRGAVIAGRVFDASGEPLTDAIVNAWRVGYPQPGNRRIVAARSAVSTNDLGEYRLYGLAAGTYYVSAGADRGGNMEMMTVTSASSVQIVAANPGSSVTFYPSTTYASDAQALTVRGGDQALGIDIRLLTDRQSSLSGRVVDSQGAAVGNAMVSLKSVRSDGFVARSNAVTDAAGRFTMHQLGPGDYRLVVSTAMRVATTQPARREIPESANMLVTIAAGAQSTTDLFVQTRPGNELRGRVLVDGAVPVTQPNARFMLTMTSPDSDGSLGPAGAAMVATDGTFTIPGLIGRGRIVLLGAPVGSTLLRVVANGLDVTDDGVDMDRGSVSGAEVHLTMKPTFVKGQVTDAEGKPVSGTPVIVFSENPALWSKPDTRYVVSTRTAPSGAFELRALPAGRYLAVAVGQFVPDQWADPENLLRLRPQTTPFTVVEGESVTVALRRQ